MLLGVSFGAIWGPKLIPFSLGVAYENKGKEEHHTFSVPLKDLDIDSLHPLPIWTLEELKLASIAPVDCTFSQLATSFVSDVNQLEDVIFVGGGILRLAEILKTFCEGFDPDDFLWIDPLLIASACLSGTPIRYPECLAYWSAINLLTRRRINLHCCIECFLHPKEYTSFRNVFKIDDRSYYIYGITAGERALLYLKLLNKLIWLEKERECIELFPKSD